MTAEQNKELVTKTLRAFARFEFDAALANMSEDASWFICGKLSGVSGLKEGKQAVAQFMRGVKQAFPEGLQTEFRKVYCDGDSVIVELTNHAKTATGKNYENDYCFVFEIEAGKIRRIREYVDLLTVKETVMS